MKVNFKRTDYMMNQIQEEEENYIKFLENALKMKT